MTLSQETMLDLMAYADGELDGDALARIEAIIAEKPEAAQFVAEMQTLGDVVRVVQSDRRVPKSVDRIADDVMKQVARMPRLVVNNDPEPVRRKRALAAGAVSAVIAIAAGWFMFFRGAEQVGPMQQPAPVAMHTVAPPATTTAPPAPATTVAQQDPTAGGVDLDQVESPREVSVFYVPAAINAKASSVVVWIDDKGAK